ncbi:DUF2089 domain-containing protein [Sphingobacterium siyangense]|uniref:DUF2089 family protein n=1 Tax=Sphingobacterium TaxID=28453 RepID=UPI000957EE1A|nr:MULTISPECIES: DUF2089 family protein [Sphingobacterium]APU95628.1 hypothetical protein BV902_04160 [Sphingobacterium sp. B29]UQA75965.1 DUF2089 domain-containing protein [Sphingobacterium siyangense]
MKKIPVDCPCCEAKLKVAKLVCDSCETEVVGKFSLPVLMQLTVEEQEFVLNFLMHSGSLKEMANQMGKSYPTVRNILDDLIRKLKSLDHTNNGSRNRSI